MRIPGPQLCPFWWPAKLVAQAVTIGGFRTVLVPTLDNPVGHRASPTPWFWGEPRLARAQTAAAKKAGAKVFPWVPYVHWWKPYPVGDRFVDSRGNRYEISPCPQSNYQMDRLLGFGPKIVIDCENYVSAKYSNYGGSKEKDGLFGGGSPPLCHCPKCKGQPDQWNKMRALLKRISLGQAFFYSWWTIDMFGGQYAEDTYRTIKSVGDIKHNMKHSRHGAYAGLWLEAVRDPVAFFGDAVRAFGKNGVWVWSDLGDFYKNASMWTPELFRQIRGTMR